MANGLLKDFGIISDNDSDEVIDSFKIQREKQRMCVEKVQERSLDLQNLTCIGLDSKRDTNALLMNTITDGEEATFSASLPYPLRNLENKSQSPNF